MIRLSTMIRLGPGYVFLFSGEALTELAARKIRLGPGNISLLGSGAGGGKIRLRRQRQVPQLRYARAERRGVERAAGEVAAQ